MKPGEGSFRRKRNMKVTRAATLVVRAALVAAVFGLASQACGRAAPPKSAAEVKAACGDWSAWECKGMGDVCGATCKAIDDLQIGCQGSGCARKSGTYSNAACSGVALDGVQGCDRCKAALAAGCL